MAMVFFGSRSKKEILLLVVPAVALILGLFITNIHLRNTRRGVINNKPESSNSTIVLAFGDSGDGSAEQIQMAELINNQEFDAIIHTGDVAYDDGTSQELLDYYDSVYSERIKANLWPSIGNHDARTNNAQPYLDYFDLPEVALDESENERYYSVNLGNIHLVSLDTTVGFELITEERNNDMADWLEQDLAGLLSGTITIVFFHHAPFNLGSHPSFEPVREKLIPIFDKYEVDLVVSGHDHNYQRSCQMRYSESGTKCLTGGTTYIVSGGGGGRLYEIENPNNESYLEYAESIQHFVRFIIDENGKINGEAININNQRIDNFEL